MLKRIKFDEDVFCFLKVNIVCI